MRGLVLTAVLWAASFLVVTQGVVAAPRTGVLVARALGGLLLVGLAAWSRTFRRPGRLKDALMVGGVGVGAFAWLELAYRSQWAPSGATALFMLSSVPLWVAVARLVRREDDAARALLASVFVVLANGVILANWERPSTFMPFTLFPIADIALLAAAAAWAAGGVEAEERLAGEPVLVRAATAGLGAAWLLVLVPRSVIDIVSSGQGSSGAGFLAATLLVGGAALVLAWHDAIARRGVQAAAFACGVAPAVLSAYVFIERWLGTRHGPIPLVGAAVAVGSALALSAAAAGTSGARAPEAAGEGSRLGPGGSLLAAAALISALAGMALPSISVAVTSHLASEPYAASWRMAGYGTVGAWLALAAVIAGLWAPARGPRAWTWAVTLAVTGVTVYVAGYSLWSAWFGWVPVKVLQALGSPYAVMTEKPLLNPAVVAAPWLALGAWALRRRGV